MLDSSVGYSEDIMMASMIVHLLESLWDGKIYIHWDLQMELHIGLNLGLMTELRCVL